jgi:hypothetical protein
MPNIIASRVRVCVRRGLPLEILESNPVRIPAVAPRNVEIDTAFTR